jgi:trimeric autotransporter adhesin
MRTNFKRLGAALIAVGAITTGLLAAPPAALAGCNSGNVGNTDLLSSANCQGAAIGVNSTAVGASSSAQGNNSTAIGESAFVNPGATNATAVGQLTLAGQSGATAIGQNATAQGTNSTAVGYNSFINVGDTDSTLVGSNASLAGTGNTGLGAHVLVGNAGAPINNAVAIGQFAIVTASNATSVGQGSTASAFGATALGQGASASGANGLALGNNSSATGASSVSVGYTSFATDTNATAVGYNSQATFANSTAIGAQSVTTRVNQVAIGTATNTYTLAGVSSAASLAAQTGAVKVVTADAQGNLATASFAPQDISALQSNVSGLQQNVSVLQQQMKQGFEGTAIAIALGGTSLPSDKRFAISTNWGNFRGQNAVGVAAQMRLTDYAVANIGVGGGFAQGGIGSRAGVTFAW